MVALMKLALNTARSIFDTCMSLIIAGTGLMFSAQGPRILYIWVCLMSIFNFIAVVCDKGFGMMSLWRLREYDLHLMEAFGGFPGALLAMSIFRHKTAKPYFMYVSYFIGIVWCCCLKELV